MIELENFVLEVLEKGVDPKTLKGIKQVKKLDEIHDVVTLFFVDRNVKTISALHIQKYFPITEQFAGVVDGQWELGGYNEAQKRFYSMGKYQITHSFRQTFVQQERLDKEEVYMEDHLAELFG